MEIRTIFLLAAAVFAVNALERDEGIDNPIIQFFEAPVRAFKTKVAEDVEPATAPEGKSVGIAKVNNNSWFRGKGLANWLMTRNAPASTTTSLPEVTPAGNLQQQQVQNRNRNPQNRRRAVNQNQYRRVGMQQNVNWNRRNANQNRRQVAQHQVEDDSVSVYSDEDDYDGYNGGRRYQINYDTIPYNSGSYEDEEDDVSYAPVKNQNIRRGQVDQRKQQRPNSSYLQPFQDVPVQARPIRLRQNLPVTKPIGNQQQQTSKPTSAPNKHQSHKHKKKKNKNKNKKPPIELQQDPVEPVHFIVHPQGNGQLPVLIPVNTNNNNNNNRNRKKNKHQDQMNDPNDYQNYQYIPIPMQAFHPDFQGIPQIQVIAQHTHTFRPHGVGIGPGYPTEVIVGPGFDEMIMGQEPEGNNNHFNNNNNHNNHNNNRKKPNKHNMNLMNHNNKNQQIVLTEEDFKKEKPAQMVTLMDEQPTKQTIILEEMMKPETTASTQTAAGDEVVEVTVDEADEKLTGVSGMEMGSSDGRQHIVVPRHLFPVLGASSLVEVANNGKFLLKTGRDLKLAEKAKSDDAMVIPPTATTPADVKPPPVTEAFPIEDKKKDETKSNSQHSVIKKDEVVLPNSSEIVPIKIEPISKVEDHPVKQNENKTPAIAVVDDKKDEAKVVINAEQLHDIPVAIVQEGAALRHVVRARNIGKLVEHHAGHKPVLRSEIVHAKPNGHFVVKSAVRPNIDASDKIVDSEVKKIKVIPAVKENSRAL